ncbi:phosphonate metabolism transcriptional regulator PhnF [Vallitalea longa]|uniref:Phosphonate metabolism transcriptional regulator PhnF n=1 Tax=Vallitalea longa TaxID=2936439 RepID=A0A9W5YBB5_9FIRM|nr:GntR family transcriptional regulator [Vallitalea longa]GKX29228.1 phosphonate metabolism transcriptional regulator PhnF [Vallitalea longa]
MQYNPSLPVYIQIKEDIIKKIRMGIWKENEKIPSELKLMEEYHAGRGTVREAIKLIIDEGYLYIKKGIGTFVAQREVGISIEPFVSLTYFIKMRGLNINTRILEKKEVIINKELAEETSIKENTKCLFVKRLRMMDQRPIGLEIFHFVYGEENFFKDFNFENGISHYLFEDLKVSVTKLNMDLEIVKASGEEKELLQLSDDSKMMISNRVVYVNKEKDILYHLKFYCGEQLSKIGMDNFV